MGNAVHQLDEQALIEQCRTELPYVMDCFSELVLRYERYVFNLCRRYLGSEEDAEDTTQDIFMRVFHTLPDFEGRSQFKTWLFRIAMNQCHTVAGKRKLDTISGDDGSGQDVLDAIPAEGTPEWELAAQEERDCVQKTLQEMRVADTEVLNLRFMGELSLEEIAETLGAKLSATKMRFYRAMEQFKKMYEQLCL